MDPPDKYQCPRCGKTFRDGRDLRRHQARKTPCTPILERVDQEAVYGQEALEDPNFEQKKCRFCGRIFSSYDSMRRHVRQACKIAPNAKNGDAGVELLYEHTLRRQLAQRDAQHAAEIAELRAGQAQMVEMMRQMMGQGGSASSGQSSGQIGPQVGQSCTSSACQAGEVAIQGNQNQVDNRVDNRVYNINIFGQEDISHLTRDQITGVLLKSLNGQSLQAAGLAAISEVGMLIYSDPGHPNNITVCIVNKKSNEVMVYGDGGWEILPIANVAPQMVDKCLDAIFDLQPFEGDPMEKCGPLLRDYIDHVARYIERADMRTILVRNKDLLKRTQGSLPVAGMSAAGPSPAEQIDDD